MTWEGLSHSKGFRETAKGFSKREIPSGRALRHRKFSHVRTMVLTALLSRRTHHAQAKTQEFQPRSEALTGKPTQTLALYPSGAHVLAWTGTLAATNFRRTLPRKLERTLSKGLWQTWAAVDLAKMAMSTGFFYRRKHWAVPVSVKRPMAKDTVTRHPAGSWTFQASTVCHRGRMERSP